MLTKKNKNLVPIKIFKKRNGNFVEILKSKECTVLSLFNKNKKLIKVTTNYHE